VQQLPIMTHISSCTASTLKDAAASLRFGNLVAFPTETVYGLGVDATNKDAVAHLYRVKGRPIDHPLIVHISSMANLDKWAREIPEYAIKLARAFWPGPMTLILPKTNLALDFVTGNQDSVGIRVPSHPLASALLTEFEELGGLGVAAPSANRFGKVSPTTADAVVEELSGYLSPSDLILDGGPCEVGVESTIINCTRDVPEILRPGAITAIMISDLVGLQVNQIATGSNKCTIKAPGLLQSHYAPKAKVFLSTTPNLGDGFIALSDVSTPPGAIRLASPKNNKEYAQLLYQALRLADTKQLPKVIVIPPTGGDLAIAICDRLEKCAYKS
jgi:L-threonylcarbamoyladenylate synthase